MGGPSAPDDLHQACVTQAWLATSEDELAQSSGGYFYHQRPRAPNPIAADLRFRKSCWPSAAASPAYLSIHPCAGWHTASQLLLTFRSYEEPMVRIRP